MGMQDIAGDLFRAIYNGAANTRQPDLEGPNPGGLPMGTPPIVPQPPPMIAAPGTITETGATGGRDYTMPDGRIIVGGGHDGSIMGPILDSVLGPKDGAGAPTAPPVTGGQTPYFDTSGGNWKNDLAKTGVAALLQLIPPLLASKNHRRQVGAAWSQAFAPMMVQGIGNMLGGRADHDAAIRTHILAGMLQRGDITFTPSAGAQPIGNLGGMPVYKTPTLSQKYPDLFGGKTSTGPVVTPSPQTAPDASPTWGVPQPATPGRPLSDAARIYGDLNATPATSTGMAKVLTDQANLERRIKAGEAFAAGGMGGGAAGDMESSTTVSLGKDGVPQYSRTIKPTHKSFQEKQFDSYSSAEQSQLKQNKLEGMPNALRRWLDADTQDRIDHNRPARTPEEEKAAIEHFQQQHGGLVAKTMEAQPFQMGVLAAGKELNGAANSVPPQYINAALDLKSDQWEKIIANPQVKAEIDNAAPGFDLAHLGETLTGYISSRRATMRSNEALRDSSLGVEKPSAPPVPTVTAPPPMPSTGGPRKSNAAAVDAVIRHITK